MKRADTPQTQPTEGWSKGSGGAGNIDGGGSDEVSSEQYEYASTRTRHLSHVSSTRTRPPMPVISSVTHGTRGVIGKEGRERVGDTLRCDILFRINGDVLALRYAALALLPILPGRRGPPRPAAASPRTSRSGISRGASCRPSQGSLAPGAAIALVSTQAKRV